MADLGLRRLRREAGEPENGGVPNTLTNSDLEKLLADSRQTR